MIGQADLTPVVRPMLARTADIRRREALRKASARTLAFIIRTDFPWLSPAAVTVTDAELARATTDEAFADLHLTKVRAAVAAVRAWMQDNPA